MPTPLQLDFCKKLWKPITISCKGTNLNPLFVAAQAALESGWGRSAIGNNLFGVTADSKWTGKRQLVRTKEIHPTKDFAKLYPKVYSITLRPDGRYLYDVERYFRDYDTIEEGLKDHFAILSLPRYAKAYDHKDNPEAFAMDIAKLGYCTTPAKEYASNIGIIAKTIESIVKTNKL